MRIRKKSRERELHNFYYKRENSKKGCFKASYYKQARLITQNRAIIAKQFLERIREACSRHESVSLLGLILPGRRELLSGSVVASKSVNSALNEDEAELAVLVLSVSLQVLPNVHCLLDQVVEVLGNLRSEAVLLQDSEDLVSGNSLNLGDTVVVS